MPQDSGFYKNIYAQAPIFVSGQWYNGSYYGWSALITSAQITNLIKAYPFVVPTTVHLTRIGINVDTENAGKFRMGIYRAGADGLPDKLILDAGEVDVGTTGNKEIVISQTLTPGFYYLASNAQSGIDCLCPQYTTTGCFFGSGGPDNPPSMNVARAFAYGALPDPFGTGTISDNPPVVYVKVG